MGDKIIQNCMLNFRKKFNFNNYPQKKSNLSLVTQISRHRVSKQYQQEGRKSQIW